MLDLSARIIIVCEIRTIAYWTLFFKKIDELYQNIFLMIKFDKF